MAVIARDELMSLLEFMKTYSVLGVLQVLPPRCHHLLQIKTQVPTNLTMGQYIQYYLHLCKQMQTIIFACTMHENYTIAILSSNIKFHIISNQFSLRIAIHLPFISDTQQKNMIQIIRKSSGRQNSGLRSLAH